MASVLATSMEDVMRNPDLAALTAIASKYWMYSDFVPWKIGTGERDEGVYFVMSTEPFDPKTIDIGGARQHTTITSDINMRWWVAPINLVCLQDRAKALELVDDTVKYAEMVSTIRSMFDEYGNGLKMPEFMEPMVVHSLEQTYTFSKFGDFGKSDRSRELITKMREDAANDIRLYMRRQRNYLKKESDNPILRFFGIPNRDYLIECYARNPHYEWSDNPLVRLFRRIKYHNSQQVSPGALNQLAYGKENVQTILLYGKHRDPETGKMYKTGTYEEFVKIMAEKYPDILYTVKKTTPRRSAYIDLPDDCPNPFGKLPCYEEQYLVSFCSRHAQYVCPIINRIDETTGYRSRLVGVQLHPLSLDKMREYGDLVVRYIPANTAIGQNVGLLAEQNHIPYAIDDGTQFDGSPEGYIPYVFRKEDADFPYQVFARVADDFSNTPGESPYPTEAVKANVKPERDCDKDAGFDAAREKEIQAALAEHGSHAAISRSCDRDMER